MIFRPTPVRTRHLARGPGPTSKSGSEGPYKSIEMLVSGPAHIEQLRSHGPRRIRHQLPIRERESKPTRNDSMFQFQIPAGAQVVDAVEVRSGEEQ